MLFTTALLKSKVLMIYLSYTCDVILDTRPKNGRCELVCSDAYDKQIERYLTVYHPFNVTATAMSLSLLRTHKIFHNIILILLGPNRGAKLPVYRSSLVHKAWHDWAPVKFLIF